LQRAEFTCRSRKAEFARRKFITAREIVACSLQIGTLREASEFGEQNLSFRFAQSSAGKSSTARRMRKSK
jgi:hypothetical protein